MYVHGDTKFINLTGHHINLKLPDGEMVTIEKDGQLRTTAETVMEHPLVRKESEKLDLKLPSPTPGIFLVVSSRVARVLQGRSDIVVPLSRVVNGEKQCQAFVKYEVV